MNRRKLLKTGAASAATLPFLTIYGRSIAQTPPPTGRWSHRDLTQVADAPLCGHGLTDFLQPVAYVRPDRVNTVLFTGRDRHIHQLRLSGGTWVHSDLSMVTKAPTSAETFPAVCVRPDNVVSIVYTGQGSISVLEMNGDAGTHHDLTELTGAPKASPIGPPTHLVRADGVAVVIYTTLHASDSSIHQLALSAGKWTHSNLSDLTQSQPVSQFAKTAGFIRSDRVTAIVYVRGGIRELSFPPNGVWTSADLSGSLQVPQPHAIRWPAAFIRGDGVASVIYGDQGGFIHELALVDGKWVTTGLSEAANAPKLLGQQSVSGYVRGDGVTAVIYFGADNHLHELTMVDGRWMHTDLFLGVDAPPGSIPFGYVRSDRITSVIYTGSDNHIHELSLTSS